MPTPRTHTWPADPETRGLWSALAALVIFLFPADIYAAVRNMSAPGSGTDLYFTTVIPLAGSGQPVQGRGFKIGVSPLTLVASVENTGIPPNCLTTCVSAAYDLFHTEASQDGRMVAYSGRRDCRDNSCGRLLLSATTVAGLPQSVSAGGFGRMSRNGRYLRTYQRTAISTLSGLETVDLGAGTTTRIVFAGTAASAPNGRVVANDGSFAMADGAKLRLFRLDREAEGTPTHTRRFVANAVINAAGDLVAYQVCCSPSELRIFRPNTGTDDVLLTGEGIYKDPAISEDGTTVAYLAAARPGGSGPDGQFQLHFLSTADGVPIPVTSFEQGIEQFTLSDDGRVAWFLTGSGGLYRATLRTQQIEQVLASVSSRITVSDLAVPGSAFWVLGSGLSSDVRFKIAGFEAPLITRKSATSILVQAPWDLPTGPASVEMILDSPFAPPPSRVEVRSYAASFATSAIHDNWRGVASPSDPAFPGELVHFYMTGLGPVDPPMKTGQPAPASPFSRVTTPLQCKNAEVVYAGLAPGSLGFYQVGLRIPADATSSLLVECSGTSISVSVRPRLLRATAPPIRQ